MTASAAVPTVVAFCLIVGACADGLAPASNDGPLHSLDYPLDSLSEYNFFVGPLVDQTPAPVVIPYVPASPLWADFADKGRYVWLPPGTAVDPVGEEDWEFPIGTIFIKTFFLAIDRRDPAGASRIIETRLLIREDSEEQWSAHTYVWNDDQTDAERVVAGRRVTIPITEETGAAAEQVYRVPDTNQCNDCHARDDVTVVLGFNAYQLDFVRDELAERSQLADLHSAGVFTRLPEAASAPLANPSDTTAPLPSRARSYLHSNCSHCHRPGGDGGRSGLDLRAWQDEPASFGVCKSPVAAGAGAGGRSYDIVPGRADESILPFRMASLEPDIRMPELPSRLADNLGLQVVREWINAMEPLPGGCD